MDKTKDYQRFLPGYCHTLQTSTKNSFTIILIYHYRQGWSDEGRKISVTILWYCFHHALRVVKYLLRNLGAPNRRENPGRNRKGRKIDDYIFFDFA